MLATLTGIGVRLRNWQLAIDVLTIDVFWVHGVGFIPKIE
jgi:hypothetical protein